MVDLKKGDCLELMKGIEDNSIDLVVTDPPYGMDFQSHRRKNVYDKIKNDTNLDFLDDYFKECERIMKDNTGIYVFCSWHNIDIFKQLFEKYFKIKNCLVWVKNNHGSGDLKASYAPQYEFILYGNKGRKIMNGKRKPDVIYADRTGNKNHPTEKPVSLLKTFLEVSSDEGDTVFDGFMGSGSTGVACAEANRNFIGIEIEDNYFNVAKERIAKASETELASLC